MAIRCISAYRNDKTAIAPGQIVEDTAFEAWLLNDSPGSFARIEPEIVDEPPDVADDDEAEDKAVTEAEIKPAPKPRGRWAHRTK